MIPCFSTHGGALRTAGALLGIVGFLLLVSGCSNQKEAVQGRRPQSAAFVVDVITVAPRPFRETVEATGTLLADEFVTLQAERAGIVKEIRFEEGQPAKAGDVLVVLDDSELRAELSRAEARLEFAKAVEARDRELFELGTIISEVQNEQNRANLLEAKAEVELIKAQLAKTQIVAPFDGITGLRQISVGAYLTPGTPVATFRDIRALKIDFSLPERYQRFLRTGQPVRFRVAGHPEPFEGTITAIEPGIDIETRSLQVRARAPNPEGKLLPGAFAEVEVVLDEIPDAILIPAIALIPGLQRQTVFVHKNGKVEERVVETGLRTADTVQVLTGLKPGDELITSGILQLRPGMRVEVRRPMQTSDERGDAGQPRAQQQAGSSLAAAPERTANPNPKPGQ